MFCLRILALSLVLSGPVFAEMFKPFRVKCSLFVHRFPGVEDLEVDLKEVRLEGENDSKRGHQLVGEHGDYAFYVVTRETTGDIKRPKKGVSAVQVYAYNAEIRNKKTGVVAQARSAGKGESHKGATHAATVSLVMYAEGTETPLAEAGHLSLNCHHPKEPGSK